MGRSKIHSMKETSWRTGDLRAAPSIVCADAFPGQQAGDAGDAGKLPLKTRAVGLYWRGLANPYGEVAEWLKAAVC